MEPIEEAKPPVSEHSPLPITEADLEADADAEELIKAVESLAIDDETKVSYELMRSEWIREAQELYDSTVGLAEASASRQVGAPPKTPDEWRVLCYSTFGEGFLRYALNGDPALKAGAHKLPSTPKDDEPRSTYDYLSVMESSMMLGFRKQHWVDPHYDKTFKRLSLVDTPIAVGMGMRYAVCLREYAADKDKNENYTIAVLDIEKVGKKGRAVNDKTFADREAAINNPEIGEKKVLEDERAKPDEFRGIAFEDTLHSKVCEPSELTMHGNWCGLAWHSVPCAVQPKGRKTVATCDRYEFMLLPMCHNAASKTFECQPGALRAYDFCNPYLLVAGPLSSLVKLPVIEKAPHEAYATFTSDCDVIMIIDLDAKIIVHAKEAPEKSTVAHVSFYPPMNSLADEAESHRGYTFTISSALSELNGQSTVVPMWDRHSTGQTFTLAADPMLELENFELAGIGYKSETVERPLLVHHTPSTGHTIKITPHNASFLIHPNAPVFPDLISINYRDVNVVDAAAFGNILAILRGNDVVEFASTRAGIDKNSKALYVVSRFSLASLAQEGHKNVSTPTGNTPAYKAISMSTNRIAVLFPDSIVVLFEAMNFIEREDAKKRIEEKKKEIDRRRGMQAEAMRQREAAKNTEMKQ